MTWSSGVESERVGSLGWEDPLKKGMATLSSIFAWEIPRTEEPGGLRPMGSQRVGHDSATNIFTFYFTRPYHEGVDFVSAWHIILNNGMNE